MNPKASDSLSKSLLIIGCGAAPLTAFMFQATPILIVTVALPLLSLVTELFLFLFLLSTVAGAVIGVEWLWTMFNDDRHRRLYWREIRRLDLEERRKLTMPTRTSRPTNSIPSRQLRTPPHRPNAHRREI